MTDSSSMLDAFEARGLLTAAETAFARMLRRRADVTDDAVLLAAALACRAPRSRNVCVRLESIREAIDPEPVEGTEPGGTDEIGPLPWPDPAGWVARLRAADRIVSDGDRLTPLVLRDGRLYLHRYWSYESRLVAAIEARASAPPPASRGAGLAGDLRALFPASYTSGEVDWQLVAAATAMLRNFTVISGGPGTGKTTTLKRIVALVLQEARRAGRTVDPQILLMAPTGKAAARMREALRPAEDESSSPTALPEAYAALLEGAALQESTIHSALGVKRGNLARFWRDRDDPLDADLVIVDEASMVDVALMTKLVEAVPPEARLILVGDRHQLASVEAGAVLGDICAAGGEASPSAARRADLTGLGVPLPEDRGSEATAISDCIVQLRKGHRFDKRPGILALATAINAGDSDAALAVLTDESQNDVRLVVPSGRGGWDPIEEAVTARYVPVIEAALARDGLAALDALDQFRVLCAHRRGRLGVNAANQQFTSWLATAVTGFKPRGEAFAGRAVLVQENDYDLNLFNGDVGILVRAKDRQIEAAFRHGEAAGKLRPPLAPSRLPEHENVLATTIHKSQGSQFAHVVVTLPAKSSPICTRELLYTAVTRASESVTVLADPKLVREAIEREVVRHSGLTQRLAGHRSGADGPQAGEP